MLNETPVMSGELGLSAGATDLPLSIAAVENGGARRFASLQDMLTSLEQPDRTGTSFYRPNIPYVRTPS